MLILPVYHARSSLRFTKHGLIISSEKPFLKVYNYRKHIGGEFSKRSGIGDKSSHFFSLGKVGVAVRDEILRDTTTSRKNKSQGGCIKECQAASSTRKVEGSTPIKMTAEAVTRSHPLSFVLGEIYLNRSVVFYTHGWISVLPLVSFLSPTI